MLIKYGPDLLPPPSDPEYRQNHQQWIAQNLGNASQSARNVLLPTIQALQDVVNKNDTLRRLADRMFIEASTRYKKDPAGEPAVKSFDEFITVLDLMLRKGPRFYYRPHDQTAMAEIGVPINAMLNWPMGTVSGYEFFLNADVNVALKDVLNSWGAFLTTAESRKCLLGWLSAHGQHLLVKEAKTAPGGTPRHTFQQLYICPDLEDQFLGFASWDAFFTRKFRDGIRVVDAPDNGPADMRSSDPTLVITHACESRPLRLSTDVKLHDTFWLKGQPYSLSNMLNGHRAAEQFVGGTVYQGFLSALSYHRWHAPISGTVVGLESVPGTYYSENFFEGLGGNVDDPDPDGATRSQPYISAVATRSIMYIRAKNPHLGLVAVVFIGMAEVSSCEFTVKQGCEVVKGDEVGMFHYGGSSYCLLLRPGIKVRFLPPGPWVPDTGRNLPVKSALAVVE